MISLHCNYQKFVILNTYILLMLQINVSHIY